jgi:hypothetical protein
LYVSLVHLQTALLEEGFVASGLIESPGDAPVGGTTRVAVLVGSAFVGNATVGSLISVAAGAGRV